MLSRFFIVLVFILLSCHGSFVASRIVSSTTSFNSNGSSSLLPGISLPDHSAFNSASSDCSFSGNVDQQFTLPADQQQKSTFKLHMKHRPHGHDQTKTKDCVVESTAKDLSRIRNFQTRIMEKKNQDITLTLQKRGNSRVSKPVPSPEISSGGFSGQNLVATLESGVSLGSGEYFIDVFIGTPPKHYSLILDTGSDLNWIQCVPCHDCFEQNGPHYDPHESSSYKNVSCNDPRCQFVSSPDGSQPCRADNQSQSCPYYYWYGDSSNTTGDFALENFTVNLTDSNGKPMVRKLEDVMFGCGHWNRGLFHGAAGLLGLGRGPLSFASQLQSLYGHSFSYCLVDRNSNASVSSKLIFGEDKELLGHPDLNFTSFLSGKNNPVDTFYYVKIKSIVVGGEVLNIPAETWELAEDGAGGTIIDSGTTLTYFSEPAYKIIKDAFVSKVKAYSIVDDFPILKPCYNVSGVEKLDLPSFGIVFGDGAVWNFPVENYFIRLEPEEIVCLAILGTPRSGLSIIGNYQQQNFHILYDMKRLRLGFAPRNCADM